MIYDISVPVRSGGVVYPGNPGISITPQQAISQGAGANVSRVDFGSHTGTHVDAPKHFFDDGAGVDTLALATLMGPCVLIDVGDDVMSVGEKELRLHELAGHTRVLIKTRNSAFIRGAEFIKDYTYLAPDGAVIKPAAASPALLDHRGPAVVFDSVEDLKARLDDPDLEVTADSVLVLRGCGPKGLPRAANPSRTMA